MAQIRLDRYLATYGEMTRKEARDVVKKGKVTVNAKKAVRVDEKVEADSDRVCIDGIPIAVKEHIYLMLNKPAGVVSATRDGKEKTVLDLVECGKREIFPVGRLDKDAEGLLLLTDDGELAHRLLSPKYHVEKCYLVEYEGKLFEDAVELFARGLDIGEKKMTKPAKLELIGGEEIEGENTVADSKYGKHGLYMAKITISEGKFHQVKRMVAAVGGHVISLKRLSMGTLVLDQKLKQGEYRKLTEEELEALMNEAGVQR